MRVKIAVESLRPSDDLHDPSHRAEVYPADDPGASPLMVTGWNWNADAARQHAVLREIQNVRGHQGWSTAYGGFSTT